MAKLPSWRWLLTAVPLLLHPLADASPRLRPVCTLTPATSSLANRHGCEKKTQHFWLALRGCQGYTILLPSPEENGFDGANSSLQRKQQEDVNVRREQERGLDGEGSREQEGGLDGEGSREQEDGLDEARSYFIREQEEVVVEDGIGFERSNVRREQGIAVVDWLKLTDRELQVQCRVETLRSSGPGGQHRNKTESAVRLLHLPTGLVAFAAEDRSQHKNRTKAFKRLREVIALEVRRPVELEGYRAPPDLMRILPKASKKREGGQKIGPNHDDFVQGVQPLLDLLAATKGSISECAAILGLSTGALSRLLVSNRVLWKGVNNLRASYNLKPIRGD